MNPWDQKEKIEAIWEVANCQKRRGAENQSDKWWAEVVAYQCLGPGY